jgi:hypothetical protein
VNENTPTLRDSSLLAQLMPNRTRAKFLGFAAWFSIAIGFVAGISGLWAIFSSAYAGSHWPVVKGDILSYEEKSAEPPGSSNSHDVYWMEFRVEFDPGKLGCTTGSYWGVPKAFSCIGVIRTLSTSSWASAQSWIKRHPPNSLANFLYDPRTGRLRFRDETIWDVCPQQDIVILLVGAGFGFLLLVAVQRRLRFLGSMTEDYDARPGSRTNPSSPDELTDLKLS